MLNSIKGYALGNIVGCKNQSFNPSRIIGLHGYNKTIYLESVITGKRGEFGANSIIPITLNDAWKDEMKLLDSKDDKFYKCVVASIRSFTDKEPHYCLCITTNKADIRLKIQTVNELQSMHMAVTEHDVFAHLSNEEILILNKQ